MILPLSQIMIDCVQTYLENCRALVTVVQVLVPLPSVRGVLLSVRTPHLADDFCLSRDLLLSNFHLRVFVLDLPEFRLLVPGFVVVDASLTPPWFLFRLRHVVGAASVVSGAFSVVPGARLWSEDCIHEVAGH